MALRTHARRRLPAAPEGGTTPAGRGQAPVGLLALQRAAGNRAVTALVHAGTTNCGVVVQRCGPVPPEHCACHGNHPEDDAVQRTIAPLPNEQDLTVQGSWIDDIQDAASGAWNAAKETGSRLSGAISSGWDAATEMVGESASSAWKAGSAAVGGAVGSASPGAAAGKAASGVVNTISSVAQGALLRPGTTGGAVGTVQKLLSAVVPGTPLSGVFDAATSAAVKAFQAGQGLSADGIVGPKTLQALTSSTTLTTELRSRLPSFSPDQIATLRRIQATAAAGAVPGTSTQGGGGQGSSRTACAYMECLPGEEVPATPDISSSAERCIQAHYRDEHSGHTVSSNREYAFLTGRDRREKDALDCVRKHFTAKSGTHLGEPDIWDFTNNTMYEVTTKNGAPFRRGKLTFELDLANKIGAERECGGQVYGPGNWAPAGPCISLGGTDAFMTVRNESGLLIYTPFRRKQKPEEQVQEVPKTDKEKEDELKEKLATLALAAGITMAVALVIVLFAIGVITAPAWLPAVLAALGVTAIIALVVGMHKETSAGA